MSKVSNKIPAHWPADEELKILAKDISSKYDVIEKLSEGGFGKVFKITDRHANDLALKVFIAHLITELDAVQWEEFKKRFIQEAEILEKCKHKNIVRVFEKGGLETLPYIVMEYVEGISLEAFIKRKKTLHFNEILKISEVLLPTLAYIHSEGLVHRDIKPANILIEEPDRRIVLIDFGIAKDIISSQLTPASRIFGSPHYMAPEQCEKAREVDLRADIYSYGVILYKMITGKVPFDGSDPQVIAQHLNDPVPDIYSESPDAPPGLQDVINKAMAKELGKRYQNGEECLQDLRKISCSIFTAAETELRDRYYFPGDRRKTGLFSDIYNVRHRIFNEDCLLKILDIGPLQEKEKKSKRNNNLETEINSRIERFTAKAKFLKQFEHHPHIVDIEDAGFINFKILDSIDTRYDIPYFTVKYIKGKNLDKLIKEEGSLPRETILKISEGILSALSAAHEEGYIYWEVIPEKIIINEEGNAVLISSALFDDKKTFYETDTAETRKFIFDRILNVTLYFPPISDTKQRGITAAVCLFGILLYEMFTGKLCKGFKFIEDISSELQHANLPEGAVKIIRKAVEQDMEKRYRDIREMQADFIKFRAALEDKR